MIDVLGTNDGSGAGAGSIGASLILVGRGGGSRRTLGKTELGSLELGDVDNRAGAGEARRGKGGGACDLTESLLDLYPSASRRLVLLSGREGIGGG